MIHVGGIPLTVFPCVYELPLGWGSWCKLMEVCDVVPALARRYGENFAPSPEELIDRFASLTHRAEHGGRKKIFRYSDGRTLRGKEVPTEGIAAPPYAPFRLDLGGFQNTLIVAPGDLFVEEGWARKTLDAIRYGAAAVADFGDTIVGFRAHSNGGRIFVISGSREGFVVMTPECVL